MDVIVCWFFTKFMPFLSVHLLAFGDKNLMHEAASKPPHRSSLSSICAYRGSLPKLHESVFLADGARVIGDVEMGKGCSVWFNTVVRGDVHRIVVGEQTNIQDGAIIHCTFQKHSTTIGSRVSIAHLAMIHGCIIEDECLIGMQAIVMDGAVVGRGSIVGAGAVVTQGMQIPPGSLVLGAPAKVVRQVKPEELAGVLATCDRYIEYTKGYHF
jgi:carbonic anhydrase/acetyltransferase-like protein (isoleucine patch superfamily)